MRFRNDFKFCPTKLGTTKSIPSLSECFSFSFPRPHTPTWPQSNVYAVKHCNMYKVYDTKKFLDGIFFFNVNLFLFYNFEYKATKLLPNKRFSTCIIQILVLMTKIVS